MNATLFATVTVRAADGLYVHGTFPARSDAALVAEWLTDEDTDTFARPIALHPPEIDPITTHATADMTGDVIELPTPVADLLAAHDEDPDTAGEVVVSLMIEPPARWLALFVGPFATVTDARAWTAEAASDTGWGTDRPRLRVHPLRRTDTVPVAAPTPGPDTEPVGVA
jgi:hypothetical protein